MELEILIQCFKIPAVCVRLPSRVTQVPFHQEFNFVVWVAHVIEGLGVPLREEPTVVGLVLPQQVDMEGRVYSSILELLRQLDSIIICRQITCDDSHWPNVFGQELSGKVFG